ncbi:MAG: hypothetical protein ACI9GH_000308 [Candidatus Paceibacteria bacterium]|jgi:hypothetical protein
MSKEFLETKTTTTISIITLIVFMLSGLFIIGSGITDLPRFISSFTYYASYIIGGIIGIYASKKVGLYTYIGKALLFMGLGMITTFIGALVWDYYDFVLGVEAPYPSWADAFFAMLVPFTIIGLWLLLKIYNISISKRVIVESIFISILIPIFIFLLFGPPTISIGQGALTLLFDLFYAFSDAVMVAMAYIILRTSSKKMFGGISYIALGLVITAIADVTFSYRTAVETYYFGDISDLLFIMAGLVMTTGIYLISRNFITRKEQIR